MDDEIKRWATRRKSALVLGDHLGKTTIAEATRTYDLPSFEVEKSVDAGKRGIVNACEPNPQDLREHYEERLKDLQEADQDPRAALAASSPLTNAWSVHA